MFHGLCFYTIMVQICLHVTGSIIYNIINMFHFNKAEDTYKGYNWHRQLYHFPSDATIASAHCDVALVHLVTSHHDGIQRYVVVITYRSRYLLGEGHVSVNHYSSTTNITKCMSADSGYFCQDIRVTRLDLRMCHNVRDRDGIRTFVAARKRNHTFCYDHLISLLQKPVT
jgi:hypothetical protein